MRVNAIEIIAGVIDSIEPRETGPGHPSSETEPVLETLQLFLREGVGWRALRAAPGRVSGSTLRRRLDRWWEQGTLRQVHARLIMALRGGPATATDLCVAVVDSCSVRAKHGGDLTGPNPTDRGKRGTKYHVSKRGT